MLLNATSKKALFITLIYYYTLHLTNSKFNEIHLYQSTCLVHLRVKFSKAIWMQSDATLLTEI